MSFEWFPPSQWDTPSCLGSALLCSSCSLLTPTQHSLGTQKLEKKHRPILNTSRPAYNITMMQIQHKHENKSHFEQSCLKARAVKWSRNEMVASEPEHPKAQCFPINEHSKKSFCCSNSELSPSWTLFITIVLQNRATSPVTTPRASHVCIAGCWRGPTSWKCFTGHWHWLTLGFPHWSHFAYLAGKERELTSAMVFHMERVHSKNQCQTKHSAVIVRKGALLKLKYSATMNSAGQVKIHWVFSAFKLDANIKKIISIPVQKRWKSAWNTQEIPVSNTSSWYCFVCKAFWALKSCLLWTTDLLWWWGSFPNEHKLNRAAYYQTAQQSTLFSGSFYIYINTTKKEVAADAAVVHRCQQMELTF